MLKTSQILETLAKARPSYHELGIDIVGIFGSYARNEANENSDIDILYTTQKGILNLYDKKCKVKEELKELFHLDVDLANEKYLKPYAKEVILKDVVYVK